jgi:hypothetical protein
MKYKINQSRLDDIAYNFILSQLGELESHESYTTKIFSDDNDKTTAFLIYFPRKDGYVLRISDDIYENAQNFFNFDNGDMRRILDKIVNNLVGAKIVTVETF